MDVRELFEVLDEGADVVGECSGSGAREGPFEHAEKWIERYDEDGTWSRATLYDAREYVV